MLLDQVLLLTPLMGVQHDLFGRQVPVIGNVKEATRVVEEFLLTPMVLEVFPEVLDQVDSLHARGDTAFLKPDPRHFTENLKTLGVRPSNAAIVGDSKLDMTVGRSLNMCCIGVLSGSADERALANAGADHILSTCLDLEALLK